MNTQAVVRSLILAIPIATLVPLTSAAQEAFSLKSDITFYGDNTEFSNQFREGETLLGAHARLFVEARLNERVAIRAGVFGNHRFGDDDSFELVRPVISLILRSPRSRLVLGTLETVERTDGPGPDRTGPHSVLPPVQRETLAFTRPYEAGMQWTVNGARVRQEAWINWQELNTPEQRERFDAGISGRIRLVPALAVAYQWHVVHRGGQLFATGPVADSLALGPGVVFDRPIRKLDRVTLEGHALVSRHVPDRGRPNRTRTGLGVLLRGSAERAGWRGHLLVWRACDFIKEEGDPNYQSLRLNGRRFRRIRDYGEVGVTRVFRPARELEIEASARAHRTESHYEYSYRVLAIAHLQVPLGRQSR